MASSNCDFRVLKTNTNSDKSCSKGLLPFLGLS